MLSCPWTVYLESLCRPNTPPCYAVKVCRMCGVFQKTLFPSFYVLYFIIHLFAETYKKRMWYTILITTAFHRFCSHFNMVLISSLPSKQIHIRVLSGLRSHHSRGITHAVQSLGGGSSFPSLTIRRARRGPSGRTPISVAGEGLVQSPFSCIIVSSVRKVNVFLQ